MIASSRVDNRRSPRRNVAKELAERFGVSPATITIIRDGKFAGAVQRVTKVCGRAAHDTIIAGKTNWTYRYTLAVLDAESDAEVQALYEAAAAGRRYSPLCHHGESTTCESGRAPGNEHGQLRRGTRAGYRQRVSHAARSAGAVKARATRAAKRATEPYDPRLLFDTLDRLERELAAVEANHSEWEGDIEKGVVSWRLASAVSHVREVLGAFYEMEVDKHIESADDADSQRETAGTDAGSEPETLLAGGRN